MIWTRLMVVAVLGLPAVGQVTAERLGAMRSDLRGDEEADEGDVGYGVQLLRAWVSGGGDFAVFDGNSGEGRVPD